MNFHYNININQKAIYDLGLHTQLSFDDLAILDYIIKFAHTKKCIKLEQDGQQYFLMQSSLISQQLPLLDAKSDKSIKRKINKLVSAKLLKPNPNNQQLKASYYTFGDLYSSYIGSETESSELGQSCPDTRTNMSDTTRTNMSDNNRTIDNITINNKDYSEDEFFESLIWHNYKPLNAGNKAKAKDKVKKLSVGDKVKLYWSILKYKDYKPFDTYSHCLLTTFINDKRYLDDWDAILSLAKQPEPEKPKSIYRDANEVYRERMTRLGK